MMSFSDKTVLFGQIPATVVDRVEGYRLVTRITITKYPHRYAHLLRFYSKTWEKLQTSK